MRRSRCASPPRRPTWAGGSAATWAWPASTIPLRRRPLPVGRVLAAACVSPQAQTVSEIVKRGKVTIGVVSGAPPFGTTDAEGKPAGYDVDVATLLAKYMAVPVEIVPLTSPSRIPAL